MLLGIAGFAAVALVLVGGYLAEAERTRPAHHRPARRRLTHAVGGPSVTASATPTATAPDYDAVATRLDAVLAKLPKSLHAPTDGSAKFRWQPMTGATPPVQYYVSWKYKGVTYGINIYNSGEKPNPAENGCKPPYAGELDCQRTVDKAGITYHLNNAKDKLDPVAPHQGVAARGVLLRRRRQQIDVLGERRRQVRAPGEQHHRRWRRPRTCPGLDLKS